MPQLHFPGGALIGCSAGFVNVAKIKGTHNAMKTGMLAAEAAFDAITADNNTPTDMSAYEKAFRESWVYSDLYEVRNLRPSFNTPLGIYGGMAYSGIDTLLLKGRTPWTFRNSSHTTDAAHTRGASQCTPIEYPPPQPPLSTDLMTALALTGTNHAEDQPAHLRVRREEDGSAETSERRGEHVRVNVGEYAGLLGRACPAGVYEYVDDEDGSSGAEGWGGKKLVINAQVNCFSSPWISALTLSPRTAFTVSSVMLKFPHKTSNGPYQRVAEVQNIVRSSHPVPRARLNFPS